jgi:hypothetical protein
MIRGATYAATKGRREDNDRALVMLWVGRRSHFGCGLSWRRAQVQLSAPRRGGGHVFG